MLSIMTASTFRQLLAFLLTCITLCAALAAPKHAAAPAGAIASASLQLPDLRGTNEHPILVEVAPDKDKEADDHTLTDWTVKLGKATVALVVVGALQLVLVGFQLYLMFVGSKDTRIAAEAARTSANVAEKALYDLERPFVVVDIPSPGLGTYAGGAEGLNLLRETMVLAVNNYGRTPATLTELFFKPEVTDFGSDVMALHPEAMRGVTLPSGVLAVAGKPFEESFDFKNWEMSFSNGIANNQKWVWVRGFVRYKDVFNKQFVSGFALVFDPFKREFVRKGGDLYNYTREEKA